MEIKGLIIQARKEFVEEHFGTDAWQKILEALPPEDRKALGDLILTARWYPFELGERLDRAIVNVLGEGKEKIFEDIGAKSAQRSLTKVHKSFLTPGDPQAFLKKVDVIYKFYYDTGRREYAQTGPNSGVMTTYRGQDLLGSRLPHRSRMAQGSAQDVRRAERRGDRGRVPRQRWFLLPLPVQVERVGDRPVPAAANARTRPGPVRPIRSRSLFPRSS